jgi:2-haloacid dehalogenase
VPPDVKALGFDVFGTVVDWRSSITREGEAFGKKHGISGVDWVKFAEAWRGLYQPMMNKVRHGEIGWTKLDDLHRMALDQLLKDFDIKGVAEADIDHFNRAWHRLDPWPDAVAGLTRLKKKYVLTTLSNGNVALMVNMAKRAGLPWDVILGAEPTRHYKPQREAYIGTAEYLGVRPEELMLCAAHNGDLKAASGFGLRTAFIPRPAEHGPGQTKDLAPDGPWDVVARDFVDLAEKMGC